MDRKTVEEALKLQAEFSARLTQNLEVVRADRDLTVEAATKDKLRQVERAGKRLETVEKNRAEAISRLDAELARSKVDLERLEDELRTLQARIENPGRNSTGPGVVVRDDGEIIRRSGQVDRPVVQPEPLRAGAVSGGAETGKKKTKKSSKKKDK